MRSKRLSTALTLSPKTMPTLVHATIISPYRTNILPAVGSSVPPTQSVLPHYFQGNPLKNINLMTPPISKVPQ